ncbi:protein kinase domain-containing protein [Fictibacillus phosphorivorans]|uniref:protein kinase domain-containing protein n=1 Tax=Fictibacillus phosphorivorans TaxID=1221500 RepID=UPI0011A77A50|nr:protein kinase [Fictibacillus phosphorivorans]
MRSKLFNNQYEVIEKLGSGGNGKVFKVKDLKSGEYYALKTLHQHLLNNTRNESRIRRFINEINIVKEVQHDIRGVLPIIDLYLPPFEQIIKGDSPYYLMPIAIPLSKKLKGADIEEKVKCFIELSKILIELHKRKIAHRDIKPENIYFLEGNWYLSDFGLVKYPDREELTQTREAVGPWTTIAPEMRRYAQNANPIPSDVYSIAKTLWMTLTENYKGFDGQYNYKNNHVTIEKNFENIHLTTLHDLLNKATIDEPTDRLNAVQFFEMLNDWFEIKDSFEKRTRVEWNFILKEISPAGAESTTWRRIDSITSVLNSVSQLKALNHTFLPGGGGLDLKGVDKSELHGYIEMNLDDIVRIIKPKSLHLETFDDPQWNYFFLETESIPPSGVYEVEEEKYEEFLLEIAPGKFIEPYHKNYGFYKGEALPSTSREIILGLKGNYVIFPKNSIYNFKMDSYGAYQTKYDTPDKFREFIEKVIKSIEWHEKNPEESEKLKQKIEIEKEEERRKWLGTFEKEKQLIMEYAKTLDLSAYKADEEKNGSLNYYVFFDVLPELEFFVSRNFTLEIKEEDEFNFEDLFSPMNTQKFDNHLSFNSWEKAYEFSRHVLESFSDYINEFEIINTVHFTSKLRRIKRPKHLFNQEDIHQSILMGNDQTSNCVVIDSEGVAKLAPITSSINEHELDRYPVIGERFSALSNTVGTAAAYKEEEIEEIYLYLLDTWYRHLRDGERKYLSDFCADDKELLIKKISKESEKYPE